jgi:DNA polymerase-3 subunit beta
MTTAFVEASLLASALRDVKSVVRAGESVMILKNVLIEADDGQITVVSSNLDCRVSRTIAAEVETAGAFTVDAARFAAIMSSAPAGAQAKIAIKDGAAHLTFARSKFRFQTLPATDYPPMPFDKPATTLNVGRSFIRAIAGVRHAVSTIEARYFLCGVFMTATKDGMRLIACDGDRFSQRIAEIPCKGMADIIVPTAAADLLTSLGASAESFTVEIATDKIRITFGNTVIIHKLIDGTFPKDQCDRMLPKEPPFTALVTGSDIISTLKRITILSDDKEGTVRLTFSASKLTIENRGAGDHGADEIPCDYEGEDFAMAMRSMFLREALESLDGADVAFGLTAAQAPVLITSNQVPDATIVAMGMLS